jgi:hypothetical protein
LPKGFQIAQHSQAAGLAFILIPGGDRLAAVIAASLALACSSFLFLGGHIFVRQKRRAGMGSALAPLILGLLVSAAVEQAVSTLLAQSH